MGLCLSRHKTGQATAIGNAETIECSGVYVAINLPNRNRRQSHFTGVSPLKSLILSSLIKGSRLDLTGISHTIECVFAVSGKTLPPSSESPALGFHWTPNCDENE
jgi:hypothetical protein